MQVGDTYHVPALLNEAIEALKIEPKKVYIDATLGGGGHSEEILKRGGFVIGIDQDPEAIEFTSKRLVNACPTAEKTSPPKFALDNFVNIDKIACEAGFEKIDGILFDLGVSSHQFDTPERGFSFNEEADLDMRMSPTLSVTAGDLINGLTEFELSELFLKLGEEARAKRFAKAVLLARKVKKIETTLELAEVISRVAGKRGKIHPATKIFQALRIAVNDELNNLKESLPKAVEILNSGGRIVVISFHSLEDGIVKRFFIEKEKQGILKIINTKPIVPTKEETEKNPRSRSAKLRIAEKV